MTNATVTATNEGDYRSSQRQGGLPSTIDESSAAFRLLTPEEIAAVGGGAAPGLAAGLLIGGGASLAIAGAGVLIAVGVAYGVSKLLD